MTTSQNVFTLNEFDTSQSKQHWGVVHHIDSFLKILVSGIHFGYSFPATLRQQEIPAWVTKIELNTNKGDSH